MAKPPLISIITPSFNQAPFLEYTLRSVLEQDYPNLEYLVVDGASTDGSLEIIQRYNSRLNWWVSEPDSGQAEAINKGLQRARGEFVAWLNSDDMYARGALRKAVAALQTHADVGMVFSNVFSIDAHNRIFNTMRYGHYTLADLMAFNIIGQPGVFMRRSVLEKAGGLEPAYHFMLDHQLWLRMAALAPIQYIDDYFAAARFHPAAKNVASASRFAQEGLVILEWMRAQPGLASVFAANRRRITSGAYRLSARYLLDDGFKARAAGHYLKSLWYHPATAWREKERMFFALAGLALPLEKARQRFLDRRTEKVRAENLQTYESLFDYGN